MTKLKSTISLTAIYAESNNKIIGVNGKIPWHMPRDMAMFKGETYGHIVIMGYNTFKSMNFKPLTNRINIVLTSKSSIAVNDQEFKGQVLLFNSIDSIIKYLNKRPDNVKAYVIGGTRVYTGFKDYYTSIVQTIIDTFVDYDVNSVVAKSPNLIPSDDDYDLTRNHKYKADSDNPYNMSVNVYTRKVIQ